MCGQDPFSNENLTQNPVEQCLLHVRIKTSHRSFNSAKGSPCVRSCCARSRQNAGHSVPCSWVCPSPELTWSLYVCWHVGVGACILQCGTQHVLFLVPDGGSVSCTLLNLKPAQSRGGNDGASRQKKNTSVPGILERVGFQKH